MSEPAANQSPSTASRLQGYRGDRFLQVTGLIVAVLFTLGVSDVVTMDSALGRAAHTVHEYLGIMWWGLVAAIIAIGILERLPQELIIAVLGRPGSRYSLFRAAAAGVLLDLCSHGILAVGAKLYHRGASAGQVMAFLIASPWNSLSLTLILITLIGLAWTLAFILLSVVIAIFTGWIFDRLVSSGQLPANPAHIELPANYPIKAEAKRAFSSLDLSPRGGVNLLIDGIKGTRIVLRWLLFGLVAAAVIRAFVDPNIFSAWFGPTLMGLLATLLATTVFEVCSEGSVPIAAELMKRADAPGNAFTFLLAGVATDYTEIMVMRETTGSWKFAGFIPLITVPQVLLIGLLLNYAVG
jgi:uncharacterized membrane protein YraQ (UPF0718 family)